MSLKKWIEKRLGKETSKVSSSPIIMKSTVDIIKEELSLRKDIKDSDWAKIWMDHDNSQTESVDHLYHTVNSKIDDRYNKLLNKDGKSVDSIKDKSGGISNKMIHEIDGDHFMTKPYHPSRDIPLAGWGTITTNNLYKAADISHLTEEVGATVIDKKPYEGKVPVTVHKFSKGYTPSIDLKRGGPQTDPHLINMKAVEVTTKIDNPESFTPDDDLQSHLVSKKYRNLNNINPLHARQIGIMDFITGNYDRHGNNLLVKDGGESSRSLLSIDHDRSFNYLSVTSPHEEYEKSAMARILGDHAGQITDEHDKALSYWWNKNSKNVYNEMNNNLNSIKDHQTRKYVRRNFDQRFEMVSEWSKSYNESKKSFFQKSIDNVISSYPLNGVDKDSIDKIKQNLPEDKYKAVSLLFDYIKKPRSELKGDQLQAIQNITSDYVKDLPIKDIAKFFSRVDSDSRIKTIKNDILMDMKRDMEKNGKSINALIEINNDLPDDAKFLNKFWESHLDKILKRHNKYK